MPCEKSPSTFLLLDIFNFQGLFFPKPQKLGKINIRNYPWSVLKKCLDPENYGIWNLNDNGH